MSAPLSEQQLAEIRAAAVRAVEAHPSTTFMAPCESLAAAVLDAALPPLLAEVDRLRRALSEATDHVAAQDSETGGWSARAAELEAQLRTARDDRDMEIVRWLGKKAREYRSTGSRQHALQADAIELMASKITSGAVRPGGAA